MGWITGTQQVRDDGTLEMNNTAARPNCTTRSTKARWGFLHYW